MRSEDALRVLLTVIVESDSACRGRRMSLSLTPSSLAHEQLAHSRVSAARDRNRSWWTAKHHPGLSGAGVSRVRRTISAVQEQIDL